MDNRYLETLQLINRFQQTYTYSPSLKDLAEELSLSEAGVSLRVQALIKEGCLERLGNRALRITEKGLEALESQDGLLTITGIS